MYLCTRGYFLIMLSCEGPFSTSIGEDFIIILPEQMLYANTISPKGTMCVAVISSLRWLSRTDGTLAACLLHIAQLMETG